MTPQRWFRAHSPLARSGQKSSARPRLEVLEDRLAPAQFTWTGDTGTPNWSNAGNWSLNGGTGSFPPGDGDDLVFPAGVTAVSTNNDLLTFTGAPVDFASITIQGSGYTLAGNPIKLGPALNGARIDDQGGGSDTVSLNVQLHDNATFSASSGTVLDITGQVSDDGNARNLTKDGPGQVILAARNSYGGTTILPQGDLQVDGSIGAVQLAGGNLGGTGTVGTITDATGSSNPASTVAPGDGSGATGTLFAQGVAWSAGTRFFVDLHQAGTDFDQLSVTGNVDLGGATLDGAVGSNVQLGDQFPIIGTSGGTISGSFAQQGEVVLGGQTFTIGYNGTSIVLARKNDTSVSLTSSVDPSQPGQSVTFRASVTGTGGTPSGTVRFIVDGNAFTPVSLNGSGVATFTTSSLSPGTHIVFATYNGSSTFTGSTSATLSQTVLKPTTTGLTSSLNPSQIGQSVTFTATVTGTGGTPGGSVVFTIDGAASTPVSLNASGAAAFTTGTLTAGPHSVFATCSGDGTFAGSTSATLSQTVLQPTTTGLTSSLNPSLVGQSVTFTASVTGTGGTPGGTVVFTIDGAAPTPVSLSGSGVATFTTSSLSGGTHIVFATYNGSSTFAGSTSATVSQTVLTPTTTGLTSSLNPSQIGQSVTFTATVTGTGGTPGGSVVFTIDGASSSPVTLNGAGVATFTTSTLSPGPHSVFATCSGDGTFAGSTSATLSQTVLQPTTTGLTSSLNPSLVGQSVTFTASVTGTGGTPSGTVVFTIDGAASTPVSLNASGVATFTTSSLSAGPHIVFATYNGSSTFAGSTSTTLNQTVLSASVSIVTSSANPSPLGQGVTFTATVKSVAGAPGVPTGTVTFVIDGGNIAPVTLNAAGQAAFSTSTLKPGLHSVAVRYSGDNTFGPSQSVALIQRIVGNTTTTLTSSAPIATQGQLVGFTALVRPTLGSGTPGGSVTFFLDGSGFALVPLDGLGQASVFIGSLSPGGHTVLAVYGGSSAYNVSLSGPLTQQVISATAPVVVSGTNGNDTLIVERTPNAAAGSITYILNGVSVPLTNVSAFTFQGLGGNDSVIVSLANGAPVLPGPIAVDGGTGSNVLTVDAAGQAVRTAPGTISAGGQAVGYSHIAATNLNNAAAINALAGPDTRDRSTAFLGLSPRLRAVQALYLDALGRAGSPAELQAWANLMPAGATSLTLAVVAGVEQSQEAHDHLIKSWFLAYLGRPANGIDEQGFVNLLAAGQSEEQVLGLLLGSSEFYSRAQTLIPAGLPDQRFVGALYLILLNRTASPAEINGSVNLIPQGGRQAVALAILQSAEFRALQYEGYYNALLHRPSGPADQAFLNFLITSGLDIKNARFTFEASPEFFLVG